MKARPKTQKSIYLKPPPRPADYGDILAILKKSAFKPNLSVERQIASHVRHLIQTKKLPEQTRLPPMRLLAEFWNTNYFTVQAALGRLVHEGLIVKSRKIGSFVAPPRRTLRRVCLYHDHNLSPDWSVDFYSRLNVSLYRLLSERGIRVVPFFDQRPASSLHSMPPEVRDMAKDGEIDALIATAIDRCNTGWLKKLDVPVASLMLGEGVNNAESFARLGIEEAVRCQRKTLGFIHIPGPEDGAPLLTALEKIGAQHGVSVVLPRTTGSQQVPWESLGFQLCEELLQAKDRPGLLFVYPDTLIRGVVTALLKHRVCVPEQITLVSHRNAESSIYAPFPVTWLTVKIEDFARGLLGQIEEQLTGASIPFDIEVRVERTVR